MAIHIKKSHRGLLHKNLGVPAGKPIPAAKLAIKGGDSPAVKKRKQFAINAKHWSHGQSGITLSTLPGSTVPDYDLNASSDISATAQDISSHIPMPRRRGKPVNWGQTALAGLLAIDTLLPPEKIPSPVVRPGLSYNQNPYGTGSQAIAQDGITISETGYKANSKDRNKKKLRIPSNQITMQNVPHPVLGIDNLGNTQYMTPGNDYQFQGEYVDEIPMAKSGEWIAGAVNPAHKGYCTPMTKSTCTPRRKAFARRAKAHFKEDGGIIEAQQGTTVETMQPKEIDYFNGFIDYVKQKGLQGSKKLNTGGLNEQLYSEYQKSNPSITTPLRDLTRMAQNEQHRQKQFDVGFAQRKNLPNAQGIATAPISPIDDYFGSETSKRPIPRAELQTYNNNKLTSVSDLGYVPNSLNAPTTTKAKAAIPKGAVKKDIQGVDYYEDPTTGYLTQLKNGGLVKMPYGGGPLTSEGAKEMLRDNSAHGRKLTAKQKRYFGYIAGGGKPKAEDGMTILDESTVKFNGPSHESGGIPLQYGGKMVEVEGDETGYKSPVDDSLTIMGNMKNPLTGRKFKNDSKILAEKEAKMNELLGQGFELIDNNKPMDKWGSLKFNSGRVMMEGAAKKKKELLSSKEHLKAIQEAMLDVSHEQGLDPQKLSEAKYGAVMQSGGTVPTWKYNQTNTEGLDPKIKEFAELLSKKGLTGFSGPESGVSQRNTKSGRASRHSSGEALDTFLSQPDAYNKVWGDPELSKYLIDNGLTVINEYDPNVAKQTGATAGHLHIGYDKGTSVSDQFRKDAAAKYRGTNTNWGWGTSRNPRGKIIAGAPQGDQQFFPYDAGRVDWQDVTTVPQDTTPKRNPPPDYGFNFTQPQPYNLPSNAQGLELSQVLPELYGAATNRVEPVHLQKYQPQLFQPYQVSFQDQLNENQGTFSSLEKASSYNPSALATLAGQKYSADSGVLGNEFRTNQGIANDITNKNIALLNDAELKNLSLADTQYTRQSQARSNTKAINHDVLNSISAKMLQNEANNRKLQTYENLYNFRFDPKNNMKANYLGPSGSEYIDWNGEPDVTGNGISQNQSMKQNYNKSGQLTSSSVMTPSLTKQQLDEYNLRNKTSAYPDVKGSLKKSISQYFNANWNK